jgi:hypothetical protein
VYIFGGVNPKNNAPERTVEVLTEHGWEVMSYGLANEVTSYPLAHVVVINE